jgi:hypothetical protein
VRTVDEGKLSEGKVDEGRVDEGKVGEDKVDEGKVVEDKVDEGKVVEGKVGECFVVVSSFHQSTTIEVSHATVKAKKKPFLILRYVLSSARLISPSLPYHAKQTRCSDIACAMAPIHLAKNPANQKEALRIA